MRNLGAKVITIFTIFCVIYQENWVCGEGIECNQNADCDQYCCLRYETSSCEPSDYEENTKKTCLCCPNYGNGPAKQDGCNGCTRFGCQGSRIPKRCQCFEPQRDGRMVSLEKYCCGDDGNGSAP